ncbi:caspase domain-containing protein [Gymnopilus junonius]|uniref:Caspase domain-containing protein n=1 Tax=Gymnopilus junonius TaxID=109634 RepID=A0A9P5NCI4_GYMJU|nr:caspase domain-containing protein [Gymnopilus junonius]
MTCFILSPSSKANSPKPRLFALLIGIDFYEHVRSLRCAVADALKFKEYLETYLAVPSDQICTLINKSASRAAIIDALKAIRMDSRIQNGDPIFIFFAGHGAEIPTSKGDSEGKRQSLVPQDYCAKPGQEIPSIPDRTFGSLVDLIAEEKGDNITVVLDCCHAASGTRGNDDIRVRSIEIEPTVHHPEIDSDIPDIAARSLITTPGFSKRGLRSHVLLAACSSSESSMEANEHGYFSSALLNFLQLARPEEITYKEILTRIDNIPGQNPQCEGVHQNRYLFDGKVTRPIRQYYTVEFKEGEIALGAGAVHGVVKGAEFKVYKDEETLDSLLATLFVDSVGPFSATLKVCPDCSRIQSKAGERVDLRLYIPLEDEFLPCFRAWLSLTQLGKDNVHNILLLDSSEGADVELAMRNDKVVCLYRDERITQFGLKQAYFDVEPTIDEVARVLKALAQYFWKLNLTNNNQEIMNSIKVEFYQLDPSDVDFDEDIGIPQMTTILPNICEKNAIDFVVDEDAPYGIKITNNSNYDFYPHLFYFDNSDLSIAGYYQPPTSGPYTLDVPLKANGGSLTIGYGSGGVAPFSYFLRDNQVVDVGFLKLFISTKPLDLSIITQLSPFGDLARDISEDSKNAGETWGTITLPVVQRRYPPTPETHCVQCGSPTAKSIEITVRDLEARNQQLNKELDILRQASKNDRLRFQEELSALRMKLTDCEKEKNTTKENIQNHHSGIEASSATPHLTSKIIVRFFNFFKRTKI